MRDDHNAALQLSRDAFEANARGLAGFGDRPGHVAQGSLPSLSHKCFDFCLVLAQQIRRTYGVQGLKKRFRTLLIPLNASPQES